MNFDRTVGEARSDCESSNRIAFLKQIPVAVFLSMDRAGLPSLQHTPASSCRFQLMVDIVRDFLVRQSFMIIMNSDPLAPRLIYLIDQDMVQIRFPTGDPAEAVQGVTPIIQSRFASVFFIIQYCSLKIYGIIYMYLVNGLRR